MLLETSRLYLRPVDAKDANDIFEYRQRPEVNQALTFKPKTIEETRDFITNKIAKEINQHDTWFQLVMVLKESGKVIGDVGLHFLDEESFQVEVGYTLSDKFQKKGFATEAVKASLNFLFSDLGKRRVTASIDPINLASIALVERLGFRKEAHFRESILEDGKWVDDLIYAMLKSDWEKL